MNETLAGVLRAVGKKSPEVNWEEARDSFALLGYKHKTDFLVVLIFKSHSTRALIVVK